MSLLVLMYWITFGSWDLVNEKAPYPTCGPYCPCKTWRPYSPFGRQACHENFPLINLFHWSTWKSCLDIRHKVWQWLCRSKSEKNMPMIGHSVYGYHLVFIIWTIPVMYLYNSSFQERLIMQSRFWTAKTAWMWMCIRVRHLVYFVPTGPKGLDQYRICDSTNLC